MGQLSPRVPAPVVEIVLLPYFITTVPTLTSDALKQPAKGSIYTHKSPALFRFTGGAEGQRDMVVWQPTVAVVVAVLLSAGVQLSVTVNVTTNVPWLA